VYNKNNNDGDIFCFHSDWLFLRHTPFCLLVVGGPLAKVLLACQVAWQPVPDIVTRSHVARLNIKLMAFAVFAMPPAKSIWKMGPFTGMALVISHIPVLISRHSGHLAYQFHVRLLLHLSHQLRSHKYAAAADQSEAHLDWSPPDSAFIRHIPKATRPACATHLAHLLRQALEAQFLFQSISVHCWYNVSSPL